MIKYSEYEKMNEDFKPSKVYKTVNFNDYDILIGRSADMNDILTFEVAQDDDLWFHASQVPGSHVVIKSKGEDIPKDVIKEAARLAAQNSKGKGKVEVVWTNKKNVKKDKDHKTGEVSVDYNKSKFITVYVEK